MPAATINAQAQKRNHTFIFSHAAHHIRQNSMQKTAQPLLTQKCMTAGKLPEMSSAKEDISHAAPAAAELRAPAKNGGKNIPANAA